MADPLSRMTAAQQAFVHEYLNNGGNGSAAFKHAYPNQANGTNISAQAARLKRVPKIAEALARAAHMTRSAVEVTLARYQIDAERIADELARLAFTELRQVADVVTEIIPAEGGKPARSVQRVIVRDFATIDNDAHRALVKVKRTAAGEITVELGDKRAALMDLARLKGWVKDKPEGQSNLVLFRIER